MTWAIVKGGNSVSWIILGLLKSLKLSINCVILPRTSHYFFQAREDTWNQNVH